MNGPIELLKRNLYDMYREKCVDSTLETGENNDDALAGQAERKSMVLEVHVKMSCK